MHWSSILSFALHREELKDSFLVTRMAQALRAPDRSPDFPQLFAFEHGDHRWKSGWDLKELSTTTSLPSSGAAFRDPLDRRLAA